MKDNGSQHKKDANRPYAKKMPEASDKGSQPYSRAYRYGEPTVTVREARESKWLDKATPHPKPCR